MLSFIARVLRMAWKYGKDKIAKVVAWIRRNWPTVQKWIDRGLGLTAIIELILQILGLN